MPILPAECSSPKSLILLEILPTEFMQAYWMGDWGVQISGSVKILSICELLVKFWAIFQLSPVKWRSEKQEIARVTSLNDL